jgi:endonuclease/exonuclease/phosphatase family metal-dependent hydrolase
MALQEVENQRVLYYLVGKLRKEHGLDYEIAYIEGGDFFTEQDVAVLALSGLTEISIRRQTKEMYDTKQFYNINKHIFCKFAWGQGDERQELLLLNVHFRAMPEAGTIRTRQSRLARAWIDEAVAAGNNVMVLGDVNSEDNHTTAAKDGDIGTLRGLHTETAADDLTDLWAFAADPAAETHLAHKQFDRILVTPNLVEPKTGKRGFAFKSFTVRKDLVIRGEQDTDHRDVFWQIPQAERDTSDHYPIVAEFELQR